MMNDGINTEKQGDESKAETSHSLMLSEAKYAPLVALYAQFGIRSTKRTLEGIEKWLGDLGAEQIQAVTKLVGQNMAYFRARAEKTKYPLSEVIFPTSEGNWKIKRFVESVLDSGATMAVASAEPLGIEDFPLLTEEPKPFRPWRLDYVKLIDNGNPSATPADIYALTNARGNHYKLFAFSRAQIEAAIAAFAPPDERAKRMKVTLHNMSFEGEGWRLWAERNK